MRWLFGVLLLANISLYVWQSGDEKIRETQQSPPAATVPGVPGLTLLAEALQSSAISDATSSQAEPASSPKPSSSQEPADGETPAAIGDESEAPAVDRETASPPPAPPAQETAAEATAAPKSEPFCARLGPFAEEGTAREAIADLAASQVFVTLTIEGKARPARYIVYLPPAASRQAALETLRELRSRKIDSFVFSRGELRNGISLGVFSQRASANRLLEKMKERGFDARLSTRERETQQFWVSLGPQNSARLTTELHAALQERYREAAYQREACR